MNIFSIGQLVKPTFSGKRQFYKIKDDDLFILDTAFSCKETAIVIGLFKEKGQKINWYKILTNSGLTGYVPRIWISSF
ncbi:MAG: SH3 domain-containing protein [Proteobacteria bacterium]|jgi:hypothetical protein|nr:SH3 domain-containing protein [Pseudomonadota bacterium]